MKKALTVFLMLALVGSVFADEPVADVNIAEFSGNASVQWGVNLDSGKTGFLNAYEVVFKLNLLNNGTKSTTGDGVWGELVLKTDGDSFVGWKNTSEGDTVFAPTEGMSNALNWKVYVDTAKVHFGPAYIGIKSGDTQTGKLKMDAAIRSADNDNAVTIADVGPANFTQGIVAGFDHDMFNVAADFRSYAELGDAYTVKWTGIVPGYTSPQVFPTKGAAEGFAAEIKKIPGVTAVTTEEGGTYGNALNQYSNAYAFALEGEFTGVENLSVKAGVSYNFSDKYYPIKEFDYTVGLDNVLGYSASAGYKLALDDTFFIRPQVGFTGSKRGDEDAIHKMAAGILFGWGDIGIDDNAGVPFMDGDTAKKVSPGVGVVAEIPLYENKLYTTRIYPSFFSGDIVPNLTAAAYGDIILPEEGDTAMGFVAAAKYAIAAGDMTITPNFGVMFRNNAYLVTQSNDSLSNDLLTAPAGRKLDEDALNLKAGVDVTGLIDNTTLSVIYDSANLLNEKTKKDNFDLIYPEKLGTLNFKVKIAL